MPDVVLLLGFLATLMGLSLFANISAGNGLLSSHGDNDKIDGILSFINLCVMGALVFIASNIRAGILSSKGLRVIAAISFSTYIVHPFVIGQVPYLYQLIQYDWNLTIIYLSVLAVGLLESLFAGLLFFIAVERPVLFFRDLVVKRWSQPLND